MNRIARRWTFKRQTLLLIAFLWGCSYSEHPEQGSDAALKLWQEWMAQPGIGGIGFQTGECNRSKVEAPEINGGNQVAMLYICEKLKMPLGITRQGRTVYYVDFGDFSALVNISNKAVKRTR